MKKFDSGNKSAIDKISESKKLQEEKRSKFLEQNVGENKRRGSLFGNFFGIGELDWNGKKKSY